MLEVNARDETQERAFRALFDRADLYAELLQSVKEVRKTVRKATEAELHKSLRALEQQLRQIQASDFFPGPNLQAATNAVSALRREIELHLSPDEPAARQSIVEPRHVRDFQGRTWATRKRPWVDRLATAWLVQRFIDRKPKFLWLADARKCPRDAIGYDFDGATFTHVGDLVTFEVVARTFGLDESPAVRRMGELVHAIDVGGIPQDEAPGIEMLVRGLWAQYPDDDELLRAGHGFFDTLHASLSARAGEAKP
jgi:hypothetical protein